jgi:hypothetical protein
MKMHINVKPFYSYRGELYYGGQKTKLETMAPSEAKAKQNLIAQLAKNINMQIVHVAGYFKANPSYITVMKV